MGENGWKRFVVPRNHQCAAGRACRKRRATAKQQRRRVRRYLAQYAQVLPIRVFERRRSRTPLCDGGDLPCCMEMNLGDKRIQNDGQQHYAQHECTSCHASAEAHRSLLPGRQQLSTQRHEYLL